MENQYFKDLLKDRALKATSSRLNLLVQMKAYESAMPYSAIQKAMKSLDRVTIYRTLETLTERGIIHKAFQENSEAYYAICGQKCGEDHHHHDHIHFKCVTCTAVTCEQLNDKLDISISGHQIDQVSIHVTGVCVTCKNK